MSNEESFDLFAKMDDIGLDDSGYAVAGDDPATELLLKVFKNNIGEIARSWGEYYWSDEFNQSIISEETLGFLWRDFPDLRESLVRVCIKAQNQAELTSYRRKTKPSISEEFGLSVIKTVYSNIKNDSSYSCDTHLPYRLSLIAYAEPEFDYLSKVSSYFLVESMDHSAQVESAHWMGAALKNSRDESFYDYAYSKVKRSVGSAKKKLKILNSAMGNDSLSDSLVKKIAKSSPKTIKRAVVDFLAESISRERRADEDSQKAHDMEKLIMLFVANDDRYILESLIGCLSTDNLPWLMPYVSSYPYLCRRLQYRLE